MESTSFISSTGYTLVLHGRAEIDRFAEQTRSASPRQGIGVWRKSGCEHSEIEFILAIHT